MADGDGAQNENTFQLDIIDEKKAENLNNETDVSFSFFNYFLVLFIFYYRTINPTTLYLESLFRIAAVLEFTNP